MPQIMLNDEQARVLETALQPIEVLNSKGKLIRVIPPIWTEQDIAEAKKALASKEPRYTTAEVLSYLRSLESR